MLITYKINKKNNEKKNNSSMSQNEKLKTMADKLRIDSLKSTTEAGSGHPTTCLSCAEIISCLFFSEMEKEDEFILSKGHAAPILWSGYAEAGIISKKELQNLRKIDSNLEGHPTARMPMIKVATGSLGQGICAGVGMSLGKKIKNEKGMIYVLLGDGECAEGSVWEAANTASHYKLNNICAIVDANRLGQTGQTLFGHELINYKKRFESFGWDCSIINGHNVTELLKTFKQAQKSKKPFAIIAKTLKGKGVSFLENKEGWHGKALNRQELEKALKQIKEVDVKLDSKITKNEKINYSVKDFETNKYKKGEQVSTREAFGKALLKLGEKNENVIALDGDVKNSTMTQYFFDKFPKRGIQTFIAEQNMTGMALGLSKQGFIPFVATFSAFLTRAHDFMRMAQYSKANIKFVGSHAGVSIGQDGPSQMGLEDISMFLSMPDSTILYPCDAVSAEKLTKQMAKHEGISYLRTTRNKTEVIYNNEEEFRIGEFKILRKGNNDDVLILAAGITVYEALKAHDELLKKNIHARVIDLYSVKPVNEEELIKNAKECKNNVLVVEDHYFGGIGSIVSEIVGKISHLYIKEIPRSGKTEELMHKYEIDAEAIIKEVEKQMR